MLNARRGITNVLAVNTGFETQALISVLRYYCVMIWSESMHEYKLLTIHMGKRIKQSRKMNKEINKYLLAIGLKLTSDEVMVIFLEFDIAKRNKKRRAWVDHVYGVWRLKLSFLSWVLGSLVNLLVWLILPAKYAKS